MSPVLSPMIREGYCEWFDLAFFETFLEGFDIEKCPETKCPRPRSIFRLP